MEVGEAEHEAVEPEIAQDRTEKVHDPTIGGELPRRKRGDSDAPANRDDRLAIPAGQTLHGPAFPR